MRKIKGWVDLQVNGYVGVNFSSMELTKDDARKACREILSSGTAIFLPTIITSPDEVYERNLPLMAEVIGDKEFAGKIPGFHFEGPFLSQEKGASGAHNPEWMLKPDVNYFKKLSKLCGGKIKMLTVAAELEGACKLIRYASNSGTAVSLGHQLANSADFAKAAGAGAKALTHLGNGLPNLLPRHPNTIWDGIAEDLLIPMIITDGHHLPPSVIKTIIRAKGADNCIVVSDAAPIAGLKPGKYECFGGDVVLDRNGRLYNPKLNCLAGSSFNMTKCMNYLKGLSLLSDKELIKVGYENPLRLIG